jgi:hypothetical protein
MERLDLTAGRAMRQLLAAQPNSEAKVVFAWRIVAGPTLTQASRVSWTSDGTLFVYAKSENWRKEIQRGRGVWLARLTQLLGEDVVRKVQILRVAE